MTLSIRVKWTVALTVLALLAGPLTWPGAESFAAQVTTIQGRYRV